MKDYTVKVLRAVTCIVRTVLDGRLLVHGRPLKEVRFTLLQIAL